MNFSIFQPEVLSTINVIMGSRIGSISSTLFFGVLFILVVIVGLIVLRKKYSFSSIIIYAALICWLPLLIQFSYNLVKEFNDTWFALFQPESEQIVWRYCRIDKYQNLNGNLCGLYPFIEQVKKNIPRGAKVSYANSSSAPFLSYYLYRDYEMTSNDKAEYIVLYRPYKPHFYENGVLYEGVEERTVVARGQVVIAFGPGQLILKIQNK